MLRYGRKTESRGKRMKNKIVLSEFSGGMIVGICMGISIGFLSGFERNMFLFYISLIIFPLSIYLFNFLIKTFAKHNSEDKR